MANQMLKTALALAVLLFMAVTPGHATQGVTDTEILLGTHLDLSGPVAVAMPTIRNGLNMRIDEINAAGGIHGRKLRLLIEDSGYQPAKAVRATQKLVGKEKVFAVISPFGTGTSIAAHGVALKAGVLHLFPWSGVSGPFHAKQSPLSFTFVVDYDWGTKVGVKWALAELKPSKVGVIYQDDNFGKLVLKGVSEALADQGMNIAAKAGYKPGDVDFSSQVARLRDAGVDLVVMATIIRETIGAYAESRKIGWKVNMLTSIPGRNEYVTVLGKAAVEGLYGIGQWRIHPPKDASTPAETQQWINKYLSQYSPKTYEVSAMVAYSLIDRFAQALEKAGPNPTQENVAAALRSLTYRDRFGNPSQSFGSSNHSSPQAVAVDRVVNGRWQRISKVLTD